MSPMVLVPGFKIGLLNLRPDYLLHLVQSPRTELKEPSGHLNRMARGDLDGIAYDMTIFQVCLSICFTNDG